jgi:Tfp pilus assembly protein PilP
MIRTFFRLLVGCLTIVSTGLAVADEDQGRIKVTEIDVAGLLQTSADIANVNLVTAVPTGDRISLNISFSSVPDMLQQLASGIGMHLHVQDKRIAVVHPTCQKASPTVSGINLSTPVSLNFHRIQLGLLAGIFELRLDLDDKETALLAHQMITIRARELAGNDVLKAAARATGVDILRDAGGAVRLARSSASECSVPDGLDPSDLVATNQPATPRPDNCPYRKPQTDAKYRRCDPLEFFSLRTLIPKGYLQRQKHQIAYLEHDGDGDVYAVKAGDYLGRDYGKVTNISTKGIDVREIFQDVNGEWKEWPETITYGGSFMPTDVNRNDDYIQEGSPQKEYNKAVNTLFVIRQSVPDMVRLCATLHPESTGLIALAVKAWEVKNAAALLVIRQHTIAYGQRKAADYVVPYEDVMANAIRNATSQLQNSLGGIMGSQESGGLRANCDVFPKLLHSEALDLRRRFNGEFAVLEMCKEAATCPNL